MSCPTDGRSALRLTAEPAVLNNSLDRPRRFSVWPTEADGWSGTPAQQGHVDGTGDDAPASAGRGDATQLPGGDAELVIELGGRRSPDLDIVVTLPADGVRSARGAARA